MKNMNMKYICSSKNIFLIILIVGVIGYIINNIYNEKYYKNTESYLDSNCLINKDIPRINEKVLQSNAAKGGINSYKCNSETYGSSQLAFYIYDGQNGQAVSSVGDLFDISTSSYDTSCISHSAGWDFYTKNPDSHHCQYFSFNQSPDIYNSISGSLYISCDSNNSPDISNLKFLGTGEFTQTGYNKINSNFNNYITYANPYCINDETSKLLLDKTKQSVGDIESETTLQDKLQTMKNVGQDMGNYITSIKDNNTQLWSNTGNYFIGDNLTGEDYSDSPYITKFIDHVNAPSHADISSTILDNYELTLAEYENTKLDYTSNYLAYIFISLVALIAVILVVLSITNPDIVSVELVIGYVILIVGIVFFGTKYFKPF